MKASYPTGSLMSAAVIGWPVSHSLSPYIHNLWIDLLGLEAVYTAFSPKTPQDFKDLVNGLKNSGFRGVNVTAPFKEVALELSDEASLEAKNAGSANLLVFSDGRIIADTTDGVGMMRALEAVSNKTNWLNNPVAILGAGGAARATVAYMIGIGVKDITIVNRSVNKAKDISTFYDDRVKALSLDEFYQLDQKFGTMIKATPNSDAPLFNQMIKQSVVMDMSYRPLLTPTLEAAKSHGLIVADGLIMLIEQARPSFEAFFGVAPPLPCTMRQTLIDDKALGLV